MIDNLLILYFALYMTSVVIVLAIIARLRDFDTECFTIPLCFRLLIVGAIISTVYCCVFVYRALTIPNYIEFVAKNIYKDHEL